LTQNTPEANGSPIASYWYRKSDIVSMENKTMYQKNKKQYQDVSERTHYQNSHKTFSTGKANIDFSDTYTSMEKISVLAKKNFLRHCFLVPITALAFQWKTT